MKINAVCFDMDGVVVDTMQHHVKAWIHAFSQRGYQFDELAFYQREGMPGKKTIEDIINTSNIRSNAEEIEDIYVQKRNYFKENAKYTFIKETMDVIEYLHDHHIPMALVTGSRKEFVEEVLAKLPISFDKVITGDDVHEGKPSPEPYQNAMSAFSFPPEEWLVIENAPLGIQSAKRAGAFCLAVETTLEESYLRQADLIVPPAKLMDSVKNLVTKIK